MKNITIFRFLVIIVCMLSGGKPVFGQSPEPLRRFSFAISPTFGMLYGFSEEIVYPSQTTRGEYLSQLLWDIKPLFYYGAKLNFQYRDPLVDWGFFSDVSLKAGIPGKSGKMEDRDWQSIEDDRLTNFSSHTNETSSILWVEGSAGIFVPLQSAFQFKLSLNVSYMHFAFSGLNGYAVYAREIPPSSGIYQSINESPYRMSYNGKVINYTQNWLIAAPGFSLDFRFLKYFSGEFAFQISPFIWCDDLDEHLLAEAEYRDYMRWGLFLEPRGIFAFNPHERFALSLELAYRYITGSRGEIYYRTSGTEKYSLAGEAGTGLSLLDSGILCKIRF